jgi:hypothetical protein
LGDWVIEKPKPITISFGRVVEPQDLRAATRFFLVFWFSYFEFGIILLRLIASFK